MDTTEQRSLRQRAAWWVAAAVVAATAFVLRLVPVLTGGGLFGRGNYDDGVYYAAAAGLVQGLMPYRDVLLLHPPGIVLALAPFAAAARLVGEPIAFAAARIAFMIVGSANAVLVGVALRGVGLAAAVTGGLCYAVFFPAVYVEHTTLLEPLGTTCLLGAVVLAAAARTAATAVTPRILSAGALLGLSTSIKIWGVVPALAVAGWVLIVLGWRRVLVLAGGVAAGASIVCLPFFGAAPGQMWQMVVISQLGRPPASAGRLERAFVMAGLTPFGTLPLWWWLPVAVVVVAGCCLAAWRSSVGRLGVVLLAATATFLFAIPAWFLHYAALPAGPLALVVGAATGWVAARVRHRIAAVLAGALTLSLLAGYAAAVLAEPFGRAFPASALAAPVAASRTCVTTEDPISLIELNALQRNLDRHCRLVADLGGYNYLLQAGDHQAFRSRAKNPRWQALALDYLRSGDTTVVGIRFRRGFGYTKASAATVKSWPLLARAGTVTVRQPSSRKVTADRQLASGSSR